jgi:disulfide bond formation protein DsbB
MPSIPAESIPAAFPEWAAPLPRRTTSGFTAMALVISIVALAGSLWLTIAMNLIPCQLCLYQRSFVMAVASILIVGLLTRAGSSSPLSLLVLPIALGSLGLAVYQVYLEFFGQYECATGIFGRGSVPQQSLMVQIILVATLIFDLFHCRSVNVSMSLFKAGILGVLLAILGVLSASKPQMATFGPFRPESCRPGFGTISNRIGSGGV